MIGETAIMTPETAQDRRHPRDAGPGIELSWAANAAMNYGRGGHTFTEYRKWRPASS
jgi:hypothetical protein